MRRDDLTWEMGGRQIRIPVVSVNTVIVGAGAAGLRCADALHNLGVLDIAVVVDRLGNGTSNNSGSDKQTYYKLGILGDEPDSPADFARTLFQGGMMHGDIAYVEGVGSAPAFFRLCELGVPFPFNRFGAYVGYKTDHDPRQRATSAGPKTSKFMFERLLEQVRRQQVPLFDRHEAVRLLTLDAPGGVRRVIGVACLSDRDFYRDNLGMVLFNAENVVLATGGPGEMYRVSVWPHGQVGSHGLAFEIGAVGCNLTELQYGLAATTFRWNLSGTYQQVVPDYFSTDHGGGDRRHFLHDYFRDMAGMATSIFLKGYQWPFHAARLQNGGSSLVDIAVHREICAGRRVFLDFTRNPTPAKDMSGFSLASLSPEARHYLERSKALQDTPYERLVHMNRQSIDLFAEHGVDLREPLEAAVCAQHCNGGLRGNLWWETSIPHLFALGELNGTHGVRPGGSALNSGQVGAMRAAQYIARVYRDNPLPPPAFGREVRSQVEALFLGFCRALQAPPGALDLGTIRPQIQARMSRCGAFVRSLETARSGLTEARALYRAIVRHGVSCPNPRRLPRLVEDRLLALTSVAFLEAIVYYLENGGGSRGGYMVLDEAGDLAVESRRGLEMRHRSESVGQRGEILEVTPLVARGGEFHVSPTPVRPVPTDDSWFENTWAAWNDGRVVME